METKRITLFCGHYGSGKTNIAVSYALALAGTGKRVMIADLDIVNPYFRTKDSADALAAAGVKLISSPYANTNVDVPAMPAEAYAMVDDHDAYAIGDVGGDERGALALGRFTPAILEENNYAMLFVVNRFRPLTTTPEDTVAVMREIEDAAGIACTGIVNNSNLGLQTTAQNILSSLDYAEKIARLTGLPLVMTTVMESLYGEVADRVPHAWGMQLHTRQLWGV